MDDEFCRPRHKKGTLTAAPPSVSELLAKPVTKTELFACVNWQLELRVVAARWTQRWVSSQNG
jgi:hypothetical protein